MTPVTPPPVPSKVRVWKESAGWELFKEHDEHESSVNSLAFAPHELGVLMLACGSSDGDITVLTFKDGAWSSDRIRGAHKQGVTSVSWAPAAPPGSLVSPS